MYTIHIHIKCIELIIVWNISNLFIDVSLMDDTAWSAYTVGLLETLCEEGTIADTTSWETDILGHRIPPKHVKVIDLLHRRPDITLSSTAPSEKGSFKADTVL